MTVELLKRSLHRGLRQQWWFYRDAKGLEIDLLHTDGLRRLAIEAKSGATVQPEWASALLRFQRRLQKAGSDAELALIHGGDREGSARGVPARSWRALVDWPPTRSPY